MPWPASSAAFRSPSASVPSAPAGGVDGYRRRLRAAARPRHAVQCLGPLRADRADRLRRRLAEPGRAAAVCDHRLGRLHAQDHHPQRVARHLLRPLDQSLSRLRARLRLLLRAADPRLSRAVAGPRFRVEAVREAGRAGAPGKGTVRSGLCAAHHGDRHQHRSVSADRAQVSGDARHPRSAGAGRASGRHRHQVGADPARSRHSRADGRAQPGQGRAFR